MLLYGPFSAILQLPMHDPANVRGATDVGIFGRQPEKPKNYLDFPLDAILGDPAWGTPIAGAGFDPVDCELVLKVSHVMVASPYDTFDGGDGVTVAYPAVILVQGASLGLAFPQTRGVVVLRRPRSDARLMISNRGAVQIAFAGRDGSKDGWTFTRMKIELAEGREFGEALNKFVVSG